MVRVRKVIRASTMPHDAFAVGARGESPPRTRHVTHHTGVVDGIVVDDTGVRVSLLLQVDEDLEVRFDHAFDPLLAERASELGDGDVVAVSGFAWMNPDTDDIARYEGRGLTLRPRVG